MPNDQSQSQRGFTLLEILVVVAIIGLLATIAIPNLLAAIDRTRQKRTMEQMRNIATAWEARASDLGQYNAAGEAFVFPANPVSLSELRTLLAPTYIRTVPTEDGWDRPMDFGIDAANGARATHYGIRSAGGDAVYQGSYVAGVTSNFDCDIIYSDGTFIAYPEGIQMK